MKKGVFLFISIFIFGVILYFAFGLFSSSVGWYGYQKWKYRHRTSTIEKSKQRKVFVKELNYKIVDSANLKGFYFKPYIEKGFRYGYHSMDETRIDNFTKYPYNLSYERGLRDSVAIYLKDGYEKNVDSMDAVWMYFKSPTLTDTVYLEINSKNHKGTIKVW